MFRRLIEPLARIPALIRAFVPVLVPVLLLALAACQQDAAQAPPSRSAPPPTAKLLVGVIDARPYVANGEHSTRFIGTQRGKWGQIKSVETESGRPLAEELADRVVSTLAGRGLAAQVLPLKRGAGIEEAVTAFQATGAERLLLIRLEDWRADAYTRVTIRWGLEGIVFDRSGTYLGRRRILGSEAVGETSINDQRGSGQEALARKLQRLLHDPAIAGALA